MKVNVVNERSIFRGKVFETEAHTPKRRPSGSPPLSRGFKPHDTRRSCIIGGVGFRDQVGRPGQNMGSEAVQPSPIKFHLTGFKKFHNVTDNPTEVLMGRFTEFMKDRALPFGATIESCTVLETAGAGALGFLLDLLDSTSSAHYKGDELQTFPKDSVEGGQVVWIHFGVNGRASRFAVEQRAVNEATFRCPDEMGWQPDGEPIVAEDGPISNVRESMLPTAKIVAKLVKLGFDVFLSDDAGRFVCNYVYYQSLRHAANHGTKCLFVHVPPFTVIPENTQLELIAALLKILSASL